MSNILPLTIRTSSNHYDSAGGGGNTKDRRSKIKEKNVKLNEQRVRQAQEVMILLFYMVLLLDGTLLGQEVYLLVRNILTTTPGRQS